MTQRCRSLISDSPVGHRSCIAVAHALVPAAIEALVTGHQQCATYGYPFAQANYSSERARTEYRDAALGVLGVTA